MRKKIRKTPLLILVLLAGLSIWYLFIKNWDYRLYFTTQSSAGVVYQNVHDWNIWNHKLLHENFKITDKEPWKSLDTQVMLKDTTLEFRWKFKQLNDSVTRITVDVTDPNRKLWNRIHVPFFKTEFEKSVKANVKDIKEKIKVINQNFGFEFVGENSRSEKQCICISTQSTHRGKAREMMNNVITLNQFVKQNELGLNGNPFVLVNEFEFDNDTIHFDFCFPILYPEKVPEHPIIKVKEIKLEKAVQGNFYGNYAISDMSWYLLAEKAKKQGMELNGKIIEEYFNDPHSGGNELEWKAEIFMSIK